MKKLLLAASLFCSFISTNVFAEQMNKDKAFSELQTYANNYNVKKFGSKQGVALSCMKNEYCNIVANELSFSVDYVFIFENNEYDTIYFIEKNSNKISHIKSKFGFYTEGFNFEKKVTLKF